MTQRLVNIIIPQLQSLCKLPVSVDNSTVKMYDQPAGEIILSTGMETYEDYKCPFACALLYITLPIPALSVTADNNHNS